MEYKSIVEQGKLHLPHSVIAKDVEEDVIRE